jgi:gliding motility-associated-like protein
LINYLLITMMKKLLFFSYLCFFVQFSYSQCSDFQVIANETSVCAPDIVRFQVSNSIAGSTYEWDVGNGTVYGSDTLYSLFTAEGVINARVKITLPSGNTCVVVQNAVLIVSNSPKPKFTSSRVLLCQGPDSILLTDVTPNSASRSWVVDGSNYGNTSNVIEHRFVNAGPKRVSLVVVDSNGCQGVAEFIDTIKVYNNPNFAFTSSQTSGCVPSTIDFNLNKDPDLAPFTKNYLWTFDDDPTDTVSTATSLSRIYPKSGAYSVKLEVSVSNNCNYEIDEQDYIQLGDTAPLHLLSEALNSCKNDIIDLYQTNDTLTGSVSWTFSGLSHKILKITNDSASLKVLSSGNLDVVLDYTQNGCKTTKEYLTFINVQEVKARFSSPNRYSCSVPHTVNLINSSDTMDANSLVYNWRIIDDGAITFSSTQENPSFTFSTMPAQYDVELSILGDNGCTDILKRNNYIYQDSLNLEFTVSPKFGCVGQQIQIRNNTRQSSYLGPDNFKWYFFDKDGSTILDSSNLFAPVITYADTGFYDICVVGYNSFGCTDTLRIDNVVEIITSDLNYAVSDTIFCASDNIVLTGSSTPSKVDYDYIWKFTQVPGVNTRSQLSYTHKGSLVNAKIPVIGNYEAVVTHSISGGCLISDTFQVHSNGILGRILSDSLSGCAPLDVNPILIIEENKFEGNSDTSLSYQWTTSSNSGVRLIDTFTDKPSLTFTENGDFIVSLVAKNSAGCIFNGSSNKILTGVRAGISISDNLVCFGDSIYAADNSRNGVTGVSWSIVPNVPHTVSIVSDNRIKLSVDSPGSYYLQQIVNNEGKCSDTTTQEFEIVQVKASFIAVDTFLKCAPIYAEFESTSLDADTLIWNFGIGDNFKTTRINAGYIYQRNSGWGEGYDITLIAKNVEGCTDTFVKQDYLVVAGPKPLFEMQNHVGCEPLEVSFIDKSSDAESFYLNYNDGSRLDSNKSGSFIGTHTYVIQAANVLSQDVKPSIIVYDSVGCAAVYEPEESVIIFKTPDIQLAFDNDIESCSPFNIVFEDTGRYVNTRQWFYDNSAITTKQKDSFIDTLVGNHNLRLIANNTKGCSDTADQVITILETPVASFFIQDKACLNENIQFSRSSTSLTPYEYFRWDFGEPSLPGNINSTDINPVFSYHNRGVKRIGFLAEFSNGCKDSITKNLSMTDANDLEKPEIKYISFTDNYELEVVYNRSSFDKFRNYNISDGNTNYEEFDETKDRVSISFDSEPSMACYSMTLLDYCELESSPSTTHCFIALTVSSTESYINELSWTPYKGWTSVADYDIFRKDANNVFVKIATVNKDISSYTDKGLCDQSYQYYITANHPTSSYTSNSYKVSQRPLYTKNESLSAIKNVSVSGENEIAISWSKSQFSEFLNYKVVKYQDDKSTFINEFTVSDTFFRDNNVATSEHSYIYTVVEADRCGFFTNEGREGKSILLTGEYLDGSNLNWSAYENWENGVKEYNVEINEAGTFINVNTTPSDVRNFFEKKYYKEISGKNCYRVYGLSNMGDTSYSNTVCLNGKPIAVLPTGFTPNGDGLNDQFKPITQFIQEGEFLNLNSFAFSIFNRWGEKIYETTNPAEGWDGSYRRDPCNQGIYLYTLTATGVNGSKIYKNGSITLLR